ncbi:glycine dehydrogenase, partial [Planococcus sp. SIMBA_160]
KLASPVKELSAALCANGMIGGYDRGVSYEELQGHMLIGVTEQRSKEDIDAFVQVIDAFVRETGAAHA